MRSTRLGCVPRTSCTQPDGSGSPSDVFEKPTMRPSSAAGSRVTSSAFQSASASMRRERWFASGNVASWKTATTSSASGIASGVPMPPRRRVIRMRIQAPGIANKREPADALRQVILRVVPQLVREDDLLLVLRERREEHRVPEDDTPRRPDPEGVGVRLVGVLAHLLDPKRNVSEAELGLVHARGLEERLVAERLRREVEVGSDEREDRSDRDEDRCARQPPTVTEAAREPHDDEERDADREELGGQRRPVLEDPVEVARGRSGPSAAATSGRRSANGRCTSQAMPRPSMPRSIPVPIGPAEDSRTNPAPRRA